MSLLILDIVPTPTGINDNVHLLLFLFLSKRDYMRLWIIEFT